jgi:ABC-2 type transport system permease protein
MTKAVVAALMRRDFELAQSYRLALAFDVGWGVLDLLLYFFISKIVEPSDADLGGAPSYFAFAVAGIVMSLVVTATSSEIAFRLRDEQLTGTLEILCAQPVRAVELALGLTSFPLVYAVIRSAAYLVIAALTLDLGASDADWPGVVVMLVSAGLAFAPIGVLAAAATVAFKRAGSIASVIVFGMTFVSGALFPIGVLPDWLQTIGQAMPTWFAFEGLRSALFEGSGWTSDASVLLLFAAIAMPCAVWLLACSLRHAKRRGTLAQY